MKLSILLKKKTENAGANMAHSWLAPREVMILHFPQQRNSISDESYSEIIKKSITADKIDISGVKMSNVVWTDCILTLSYMEAYDILDCISNRIYYQIMN